MQQSTNTSIKFWKDWGADIRYPYFFLLLLTLVATGLGIYHYLTGDSATVQWVTDVHLQATDATLHAFERMLAAFEIPINGYLATEQFDASLPQVNYPASYFYLGLLSVALVFYLAIASTFSRRIYLGAMLFLMLFLASFNLDLLGIFSVTSKYGLILALSLLAGVSYAFQAFFPHARFTLRILAITVVVVILGAFVFIRSSYSSPVTALHLVNYASVGSLIASVLFILLIAYENVHALLWVNAQARNPANRFGLWQFMLICLLYLLNLLLLYFRSIGLLQMDIFYLDAFVVLFFSAMVGLWGLRDREQHYRRLFPFAPGGAYLYLVLATITFLNIGYAFATANDPLIAAYNDIIVYTHLAFGSVFFIYVVFNFGRLISQKLRVYRVVYDPKRLPFYTVYLMGSILLLALLLRADLYLLNQTTAGYHNYMGDLYKAAGNHLLAERFYVEGSVYEHYNVKSNYALAGLYREQNRPTDEANALKEALRKRPKEKIYVRLANVYAGRENFFEQLFILQQGLQQFPQSSHLLNNMALLYARTDVQDSVAYYYDRAQYFAPNEETIQSNRLSFLLKNGYTEEAVRLADVSSNHLPLRSNSMLLKQIRQEPIQAQPPQVPVGEPLTPEQFALFYHTHLHQIHHTDTAVVRQIDEYLRLPENTIYDEDLTLLKAAVLQYNGQPAAAKATLENLAGISNATAPYYRDVLGLWMMEQDLYRAAAAYFEQSKDAGYPQAFLHHAYALGLSGRKEEAIEETRKVFVSNDSLRVEEAQYLFYLLHLGTPQALAAPDSAKVQYLALHRTSLSEPDMVALVQSVREPALIPHAALEQVRYYLQGDNLPAAQQTLQGVQSAQSVDSALLSRANLLQAEVWLRNREYEALRSIGQRYFTPQDRKELLYFEAALAEANNQHKEARTLYDRLVVALPYNEEGLLAAGEFYSTKLKDDLGAYNILLNGIIYNRYSVRLYKAYILKSVEVGFESFARNALNDLQALITPAEYLTFRREFEAKVEQRQQVDPDWQ